MTVEELKEVFEGLKKEGYTEEEILKIVYIMYADGKMPLEDLRTMTEVLGWEFTEEFEAMSEEDKKTKGLKRSEKKAEDVDKEEIEDAKEYEAKDEAELSSKDDSSDDGEDEEKAPETEDELSSKDDSSDEKDDDDKKAARLFGFGGKKD